MLGTTLKFASVLCTLAGLAAVVESSPTGAPATACPTMIPGHGFDPQTSPSPYTTIPTVQSDNSVRLTLLVTGDGVFYFKGYLVMAFDNSKPDGSEPIGTFSETVSGGVSITPGNYVDCSSKEKSAATHRSNDDKLVVNLLWLPPSDFNGTVVFKTTFVQNATTYWVKVPASDSIDIVLPDVTTVPTTTVPTTPTQHACRIGMNWMAMLITMLLSTAVALRH